MSYLKDFFKKIIIKLLLIRAKSVLKKGSKVCAITGSVGKTTCKEFLTELLELKYDVKSTFKGFNTPIGIMLSILDERESGWSSPLAWIKILFRVYTKRIYVPDVFVFEYGVDQKGDMDELLAIAQPEKVIITHITEVHIADGQFSSLDEILTEKSKIAKDAQIAYIPRGMQVETSGTIEYFNPLGKDQKGGFSFEVDGEFYHASFFGNFLASSLAPCVHLALSEGISSNEIQTILSEFKLPKGRGRLLEGVNGAMIWDSSYNASPSATRKMLQTLKNLPYERKIALIGNMNELGPKTAYYHEQVASVADECVDLIFFYGESAEYFKKGIKSKSLEIFKTHEEAVGKLKNILKEGDIILIKGSQNKVRLEKVVKKLLKNPEDSVNLARQGEAWDKI